MIKITRGKHQNAPKFKDTFYLDKTSHYQNGTNAPQHLGYIWAEINPLCFRNVYLGLNYPYKPTLLS